MSKALKAVQKGFTIIELLIVIAIIAILALFVINNIQGGQAKARDQQRVNDVNAIKNKLEDVYNEKSSYPLTADTTTLEGIEEGALKDPIGNQDISNNAAVATMSATDGVTAPKDTGTTAGYVYIPVGCDGDECSGYVIKAGVEKGTDAIPVDTGYIVKSLNQPN